MELAAPVDLAATYREHLMGLDEQDIRLRVPPWMVLAKGPMEEGGSRRCHRRWKGCHGNPKACFLQEKPMK